MPFVYITIYLCLRFDFEASTVIKCVGSLNYYVNLGVFADNLFNSSYAWLNVKLDLH